MLRRIAGRRWFRDFAGGFLLHRLPGCFSPLPLLIPAIMRLLVGRLFLHPSIMSQIAPPVFLLTRRPWANSVEDPPNSRAKNAREMGHPAGLQNTGSEDSTSDRTTLCHAERRTSCAKAQLVRSRSIPIPSSSPAKEMTPFASKTPHCDSARKESEQVGMLRLRREDRCAILSTPLSMTMRYRLISSFACNRLI